MGSFAFELPTCVIDGLESGPEVSTNDIKAIMKIGSLTEPTFLASEPMRVGSSTQPILLNSEPTHIGSLTEPIMFLNSEPTRAGSSTKPTFLDSEPTHAGRKQKAKDMSGLTVCLCGEHIKPGDEGSIQCQKAGCATVWVCDSATFDKSMANTSYSITFNVLGMRMHNQEAGYASLACTSQAQARRLGVASIAPLLYTP